MKKVLLILRHEVYSLLSRPSFWLALLGFPLVGFLIVGGANYLNAQSSDSGPSTVEGISELFTPEESSQPQGYVDLAGIVKIFPENFPHDRWLPYEDTGAARRALDAGEILGYYVIEPDYLYSGDLTLYSTDFSQTFRGESYGWLEDLLSYNLLDGDAELAALVRQPFLDVKVENIAPEAVPVRNPLESSTIFIPYGMMTMLLFTIFGSSSLMLNSITKEKENRVMEVLMLSANPREMLLGKIAGLGLVGLLQVIVWGASALILLRIGGQTFDLPEEALLEPSLIGWAVVFFVLGYLLNAVMMAGLGALAPSLREASQATMIIVLPLMVPYFLLTILILSPNGPLAVFLSLFPFTAPLAMILRLTVTEVPLWQILLSMALLAAAALLMIRMVAGIFRAQTILSGQKFHLKRLFRALAGKE